MNYMLYLTDTGEMRAYNAPAAELEAFRSTLGEHVVLHLNGTTFPANIPDEQVETFTLFLKTLQRQWGSTITFLAPKPEKVEAPVVEAPVAAAKPKKTRKKKETK